MLFTAQINDKQKHLLERLKEIEKLGDGSMTIQIKDGKIANVDVKLGQQDIAEDDPFKDLRIIPLN